MNNENTSQEKTENQTISFNTLLDNLLKESKMISNTSNGISGLSSGFNNLDKTTSGWQKGDLIIVSGRPSMGKTAFIVSMICNMAIQNETSVGLISLEQTSNQLLSRIITTSCGIRGDKLRRYDLDNSEFTKINELQNVPIYIECPSRMSIQELCDKARSMVEKNKIQALFIDYVQLLSVTNKYTENRYNEVNYISRELKALAKELNIPIFAVSQMNRNIQSSENITHRPRLTDLRDSGTLCDDADIVCFIYRPEYYGITVDREGNSLKGKADIMIVKHRNGSIGDIKLQFCSKTFKFEEEEEEDNIFENHKFVSKMNG